MKENGICIVKNCNNLGKYYTIIDAKTKEEVVFRCGCPDPLCFCNECLKKAIKNHPDYIYEKIGLQFIDNTGNIILNWIEKEVDKII